MLEQNTLCQSTVRLYLYVAFRILMLVWIAQYPYRSVQIVLRLYQSPAEILAGFDIDAPCCAYDGEFYDFRHPPYLIDPESGTTVWANPRAIVATMRQCNTVDMSRRSPSYEVRLTKYASRGFEIYIPDLRRADIDPTVRVPFISCMLSS